MAQVRRTFLATTAREDFWQPEMPMVFLTEGCRRYTRRAVWASADAQVLPSPWRDDGALRRAREYSEQAYLLALPVVAEALNRAHGLALDLRFWRIHLGYWLRHYVATVYDRYLHLKAALAAYPDLTTTVLDRSAFVTPLDVLDWVLLLKEDAFNLQIYSRILDALGFSFPVRSAPPLPTGSGLGAPRPIWKRAAERAWRRAVIEIIALRGAARTVILKDPYLGRATVPRLMLSMRGGVLVWPGSSLAERGPGDTGTSARTSLRVEPWNDDEFTTVVARLIPEDLPRSFLDYFSAVRERAGALPPAPAAVFTAGGANFDEPFRAWLADAAGRGSRLLFAQHGGTSGSLGYLPGEAHDLSVADLYYTWGWDWTTARGGAPLVPLRALKLAPAPPALAAPPRRILLGTTTAERYSFALQWTPEHFACYLDWQMAFAAALPMAIRDCLRVRVNPVDTWYGWDTAERWRDAYPTVPQDSPAVTFKASLADASVYVSDHLSTTFLEAMVADKPTLLFWNPAVEQLQAGAEPYYRALQDAGVLHHDPRAAAEALHHLWPDPVRWWHAPERRDVVGRFRELFARVTGDPVEQWRAEFTRVTALRGAEAR